jgi:carbonic anhydrase/acetyltransferase-like protein (isoleucine patch superfamily)
MAVYQLSQHIPVIDSDAYVAPGAAVIGQVLLSAGASVWFNATVRGDNAPIRIGLNSNVQESSVLHTDEGIVLTVGDNVTIGHQAMLHGCTIGDGSLIGIQAVILNHAVIGKNCLVAAGALVTEGKQFPDGSLILGSPARAVRQLTGAEREHLVFSAKHYAERQRYYREQLRPAP